MIAGTGSLKITANENDGIKSKDVLVIENGNININTNKDGIQGKDSITIKDCTITITSGADGIKSNNDKDEEKGYILIDGGTFNIASGEDAIQAETNLAMVEILQLFPVEVMKNLQRPMMKALEVDQDRKAIKERIWLLLMITGKDQNHLKWKMVSHQKCQKVMIRK